MNPIPTSLHCKMPYTHNPLRGLTMSRVITEMEAGQRGDYSNLQWLYDTIERRDATIRGSKRRLLSAVLKLSWEIKIRSGLPNQLLSAAEKQKAALKNSYRSLKGFEAALRHLALAEFRGFSHVEKHFGMNGEIIALQPVPQWHWCRDGYYGEWLFQEEALTGGRSGVAIDPANFIIREVEDPINEIALVAFTRKGLSTKDFDAYISRYGIPFVYWVLPDTMAAAVASDPAQINKWMPLMRGIGSDGEGIFPGGAVKTLDSVVSSKDSNPFLQHIGHQDEDIVMAATSGKLTMLNDSTGIGGGNAKVHQNTFDDIAQSLAMEISETLHEQFDVPELARLFPGQEPHVYFKLGGKNSTDLNALIQDVKTLDSAGWQMDVATLRDKTGYNLRRKSLPAPMPPQPSKKIAKAQPRPGIQKNSHPPVLECIGRLSGGLPEIKRQGRKFR